MKRTLLALTCFGFLQSASVFGWNALGHRLIAQIAYDQMTSHAKYVFNHYNHALDVVYKPQSWVNAAVWLDTLRYQDIGWFDSVHYVDFPFSEEGRQLPLQEMNALWAIEKATKLLYSRYATDFDKGIALRVLLHVVGDIHQPLHTITKVSAAHPQGDRGGNLVTLKANPIANNLHAYWDRGAGFLVGKKYYKPYQMKKLVATIEQAYPCSTIMEKNPMTWAKESHILAINQAYKPLLGQSKPDKQYQDAAQKLVVKQIALAGCRLGALLNQIDQGVGVYSLRAKKSRKSR